MATKLAAAAQKKIKAKPKFKGKYPGPDKYKGKPPPKKAPVKKPVAAKPAPKPVAPKAPTPTAPVQVPVAGSGGSLVSPATWEQDQARLTFAKDDQDEAFGLLQEGTQANLNYQSQMATATRERDEAKLGFKQQRDQLASQRPHDFATLNSNLAYRGAARRSSASARQFGDLNTQYAQQGNALNTQEAAATTDFSNSAASYGNARSTKLAQLAQRRLQLSGRNAATGGYTSGTKPVTDTGITAPKPVSVKPKPVTKPKPAAKPKPKFKGKYPGPDKYKGKPPPKKKPKTAAAQRKIARK